jgi:hypothetical protein
LIFLRFSSKASFIRVVNSGTKARKLRRAFVCQIKRS